MSTISLDLSPATVRQVLTDLVALLRGMGSVARATCTAPEWSNFWTRPDRRLADSRFRDALDALEQSPERPQWTKYALAQALFLCTDIGDAIRTHDPGGAHREYWLQDGDYVAHHTFHQARVLTVLYAREREQAGGAIDPLLDRAEQLYGDWDDCRAAPVERPHPA